MWVGGQIGRLIMDCLGGWMGITYVWCFLCKLLRLARLSALVGFLDLVSYLKLFVVVENVRCCLLDSFC